MSPFRLALFACLLAGMQAASDRRPLRAALDQVLDAVLDVVAPVSDALGDSPCRRQGLLYRQAVKEGKFWALHMLDAGAKIPSSLLHHNLVQLGNFDECLGVRHEDPELGLVEGQHCQVSFGAENAMSALSLTDKLKAGGINITYLKHIEQLVEQGAIRSALQLMGGSWAVCVPAACSAAQLQLHLRSALPSLPIRVEAHACTSRADALPEWGWHEAIPLVLLSVLLVLLAVGTTYDLVTSDRSPRSQKLLAFSLYTNCRQVFSDQAPRSDLMRSINGIRCLATLLIILSHFTAYSVSAPLMNFVESMDAGLTGFQYIPVTNSTLHVDTFLVISGILLAYNYIRQRELKNEFSLKRFYLNRYLRIAPAQAVAVLGSLASMPFTNSLLSAPLVKANVAPMEENCKNLQWLSLLYVTNYLDPDHICTGISWYLSIEMQLLVLAPLVLYPLWRSPRLGLTVVGLLSLAVTGLVFSIAYEHRIHVVSMVLEDVHSANMDHIYFFTHTRVAPWLLGLAVGALMTRRITPSRRQAVLGWCACAALTYYSMFHAYFRFQHDFVPERLDSAVYFTLMRPAWALAVAWVIFACETGCGGFIHVFLGWHGWQLPSRLSYCVFLTHIMLIITVPVAAKTEGHLSIPYMFIESFGAVVISLLTGTLLHLSVEMPVYNLYQLYQSKPDVSSKAKDS